MSCKLVKCCRDNNVQGVKKYMARGVDVNARDSGGWSALCVAMSYNRVEIVKLLLTCASIKLDCTQFYTGRTGLHFACANNYVECTALFLSHPNTTKEIVTSKDKWGSTAEMKATSLGYHHCAKLVREYLDSTDEVLQFAPPFITSTSPPVTLIPECPICMEELKPPLQIFNCGNGHVICSTCRPRVARCHCQEVYRGRATTVEQMIRQIMGIN